MKLKQLFTDDRAVSPVIGVILMVAITVILAAVIGTFVLGLGSGLNTAPQVTLGFEAGSGAEEVVITHEGGESLDTSQLTVIAAGSEVSSPGWTADADWAGGETQTINATGESGETLIQIRDDESGQVIGSSTVDVPT